MGAWNWLDWTFALVVALSVVAAILKGFIRELVSLASLVIGLVIAAVAYPRAALWFEDLTKSHEIALGLGFLVLFLGTLLLGSLVSLLARKLLRVPVFNGSTGSWGRFSAWFAGSWWIAFCFLFCLRSPSNRRLCSSRLWPPTSRREQTLFHWQCLETSNRNFAWGSRNSEIHWLRRIKQLRTRPGSCLFVGKGSWKRLAACYPQTKPTDVSGPEHRYERPARSSR